jgi:hypothetical protein
MKELCGEQAEVASQPLALVPMGNIALHATDDEESARIRVEILRPFSDYYLPADSRVAMRWPGTPGSPAPHTVAGIAAPLERTELTASDVRLLRGRSKGLRNDVIAETEGFPTGTMQDHVAAIVSKLGASSMNDAITRAIIQGADLGLTFTRPRHPRPTLSITRLGIGTALGLTEEGMAQAVGLS